MANKKHEPCETLPASTKAQHSTPRVGLVPLPFTGLSRGAVAAGAPPSRAHTPGKDCHPGARQASNTPGKGPGEAGKAGTGRSPEAAGSWRGRLWAGQGAGQPPQGRAARQATPEQAGGALGARSSSVRGARAPQSPPRPGSPSGCRGLGLGPPERAAMLGLPQRRGSAGPGHWGKRAAPATSSPRARPRRRGRNGGCGGRPRPSLLPA